MNKLYRRLKLLKNYLSRNNVCDVGPPVIGIETTNRCNLKCTMCPRTYKMKRDLGDMDLDLFKKIIEEGKDHLEFVWLQNYGEPLLTKDLFEMIQYAKQHNIKTGISTNATFLNEENARHLIDSSINEIIFAFDGATKETYEKVRIGAKYDLVKSNILKFLEIKRETKAKIFVVLQCICMRATEEEIQQFKDDWNVQGVDAVRIRQVTYSIDRQKSEDKKFVNTRKKLPCYWLWRNPHVQWDGTVIPCCQDVNGEHVIGDLKESTLKNVWNSSKMQELRQMLSDGRYDKIPMCKGCNMYQPTLPVVLGSAPFSIHFLNKIIPFIETFTSKMRYGGK